MKAAESDFPRVRDIVTAAQASVAPWGPNIEAEVVRAAKSYVWRLRKTKRARLAGRRKQANALSYWLMTGPGAKLCAAILTTKEKSKRPLQFYLNRAADMNPRRSTEEAVRVIGIPKGDGRLRPITIVGPLAAANQELVKTVYIAKLGHSEYEFSRRGRGREAVIRNTLQSIKEGETTHLVEADIADYFPSVNGLALARFFKIPSAIVRHTLLISPSIVIHYDKSFNISPKLVRRGLPMGFRSSPFFASKLLEPILKQLETPISRSFIDNLGFGACGELAANEKKDTLAVLLQQHPAGPFSLKYARTFTIDDENDILGYWVRRQAAGWGGGARATPSKPSILRAQRKLFSKLCYLDYRQFDKIIEEWAAAWTSRYPVWGGRKHGAVFAHLAAFDHVARHVGFFNKKTRGPFKSFSEMWTTALVSASALPADPFYRPIGPWNTGLLCVKGAP